MPLPQPPPRDDRLPEHDLVIRLRRRGCNSEDGQDDDGSKCVRPRGPLTLATLQKPKVLLRRAPPCTNSSCTSGELAQTVASRAPTPTNASP